MERELELFFVDGGLLNGEEGVFAITTDERTMKDGWYYTQGDDVNGEGPFWSDSEARRAADRDWGVA